MAKKEATPSRLDSVWISDGLRSLSSLIVVGCPDPWNGYRGVILPQAEGATCVNNNLLGAKTLRAGLVFEIGS